MKSAPTVAPALVLTITMACLTGGCGQKGPLYIPEQPAITAAPEPTDQSGQDPAAPGAGEEIRQEEQRISTPVSPPDVDVSDQSIPAGPEARDEEDGESSQP